MTRRETFDKKQQKLERMEKIVRDATRLKDAIKSEVDAIMEEIDAEINSPKKAKPFFWDGKQPHYWNENERVFRKATKHDIGKTVIVCNWHDPSPMNNLENKALLEGITQFDDFTVRSTNGSRLCHFPLAWVECNELDLTFDHVPHICVFMGNALAKVTDKSDIGKMVRVTMQLGVNPEKLPEAELVGFTRAGELITLGTKGEGVCWPFAWIECDRNETIESDGKRYITIQVENVELGTPPILKAAKDFKDFKDFEALVGSLQTGIEMQVKTSPIELAQKFQEVIDKQATQPEQADPLIDEESFLKPEPGTVAEEKWSPRIGDWVRIKKCIRGCWVSGMDYLDGQIRQIEELTPDDQGIVVDSYRLCEDCIDPYPWEPREGEKVQVINVDRVYEVEGFDRITKMVFCVGRSHGIELRLLKPYIEPPADHIADANKMVPPAGYRLLDKSAKVEPRKAGDLFWSLTLGDWKALSDQSEQDANRDDWPACRKIEQPAEEAETIARYDSEGRDVTELAGLWTEGDTQYREPTQADLASGPIEVEVCDDTNCDTNWEKRQLYAILPSKCMFRYIVGAPGLEELTQSWKHARIKVEG